MSGLRDGRDRIAAAQHLVGQPFALCAEHEGHRGSELELRTGPLAAELTALGAEGVQSLLVEGGPTIATSFLSDGLVLVGVSAYWQTVFVGAVIVIAVMLNSLEYGRPRRTKQPTAAPADATTTS